MQLKINDGSSIDVSSDIFGCEVNEGLVHQLLTAYQAAGRQGSKAQKTRAEVAGGGIKPWKQKGTGRARAGTTRGPLWRGGGVTFAAKPRNFEQKLNKKMYQKGIKIIFSELLRQDRFLLTNEISLPAPKTKELVKYLNNLNLNDVLILVCGDNRNLSLAARNLYHVDVCDYEQINPVTLLSYEKILMTVEALKKLQEHMK
ncbi:MAG: 50S ribosomal protein L4 [Gammaproteobacteria bacterium RIFCSPHIGHO2_12_FULL_38_14]|nr:MAG: 50S ribosomal protein L4 [Gammaproteobacteria bacterium RIFCSPHIGHO2_12_FULL_38_14]